MSQDEMDKVAAATMVGGATLTGLLGTSAWYAPGAAVISMVHAIACDQKKVFPCSVLLNGEYGFTDICLGVPVVIGKNGIESIVEITLNDAEKANMIESAKGVASVNELLNL
jgi:malate dehydrogenase